MIKLVNILKEIKVLQPIPKFKTNDELAKYMKLNSSFKKRLIDTIWDAPEWKRSEDENWNDVLNGWYNAKIEQYSDFNVEDEIMLDDKSDNRLYISIHPMVDFTPKEQKVNLENNTFYWQYY